MREKQCIWKGRDGVTHVSKPRCSPCNITLGEGSKKTTGFYILASVAFTELAMWIIYWFK